MEIKAILDSAENKKDWGRLVSQYPYCYFLQSWNWGEVNQALGNRIFRFGVYEQGKLAGCFLAIMQESRKGFLSYKSLVVPAGPVLDFSDRNLVAAVFHSMKQLAKKERADFLRVRVPILSSSESESLLASMGFRAAPMHLHAETTWQLDLRASEEELLKAMRKTTRYSIRKAAKDGVQIRSSIDPKDAVVIYDLQKETVGRHRFAPFPLSYFETQLRYFGNDKEALLYLADYQSEVVAAALIVFFGQTAVYHLGASSSKYSHLTASQLIQWEAIKEAKKRGIHYYNFWGVIENDDEKHPWYGLSLFKKGFGGAFVKFLHAQDYPCSWRYPAIFAFETVRRVKRGL